MNRKAAILGAGLLLLVCLLYPRPLVKAEESQIMIFRYNPCYGQETGTDDDIVDLSLSPEQEAQVLHCLSQYKVQNTLTRANTGHGINTIAFEIYVKSKAKSWWIVVGDPSRRYESYGTPLYAILNGASLREDLVKVLHLPPFREAWPEG